MMNKNIVFIHFLLQSPSRQTCLFHIYESHCRSLSAFFRPLFAKWRVLFRRLNISDSIVLEPERLERPQTVGRPGRRMWRTKRKAVLGSHISLKPHYETFWWRVSAYQWHTGRKIKGLYVSLLLSVVMHEAWVLLQQLRSRTLRNVFLWKLKLHF